MAEQDPAMRVMLLAVRYWASRCLHVVADLGVADALGDEPQTATALAQKVSANPPALHRILRALSNHGIFTLREGRFAHNSASVLLKSDAPASMRSLVRMAGFKAHWDGYRELDYSLLEGKPAIDRVVTGGLFSYLADHPQEAQIFDEAMTGKAFSQIPQVLAAYDFSGFSTIGDIGGGAGHLLYAVLAKTPSAKGVLFDLPQVIARAKAAANPRVAYVDGDFFKDAIPPCDAYMMMTVLHDWSDEQAVQILNRIGKTAPAGAKLLLIESVIDEEAKDDFSIDLDIEMLVMANGRERTRAEWDAVLEDGGWRMERVIETPSWCSIVEGVLG